MIAPCGRSSMAERQPSKLAVVGSTPIARFQHTIMNRRANSCIYRYLFAIGIPIFKIAGCASKRTRMTWKECSFVRHFGWPLGAMANRLSESCGPPRHRSIDVRVSFLLLDDNIPNLCLNSLFASVILPDSEIGHARGSVLTKSRRHTSSATRHAFGPGEIFRRRCREIPEFVAFFPPLIPPTILLDTPQRGERFHTHPW